MNSKRELRLSHSGIARLRTLSRMEATWFCRLMLISFVSVACFPLLIGLGLFAFGRPVNIFQSMIPIANFALIGPAFCFLRHFSDEALIFTPDRVVVAERHSRNPIDKNRIVSVSIKALGTHYSRCMIIVQGNRGYWIVTSRSADDIQSRLSEMGYPVTEDEKLDYALTFPQWGAESEKVEPD